MALTQADKSTDTRLITAMEVKIFTHAYSAESDADRVARVEKFVYGSTRDDGTLNERVARLATSVRVKPEADVPYLPRKRAFSDWTPSTPIGQASSKSAASQTAGAHPTYPRVCELEERLFGQNYADEPIVRRLDRLETREFGHISRNNDLAVRVDTLVSYAVPAPQSLANQLRTISYRPDSMKPDSTTYPASTAGNYNSNMFGLFRTEPAHRAQASTSYTVVDQIEFLENATFGRTRPNKTLQKRVHALEEKFYGSPTADSNAEANKDISSRVAHLLSLVNNGNSRNNLNRTGA